MQSINRIQCISSRKSRELSLNSQVKLSAPLPSPVKKLQGAVEKGSIFFVHQNTIARWCLLPVFNHFVFFQIIIIKKKKNIIYFRTQLLLSTLPSLWGFSHMFIFFVPCCIHSVVQTEWKQINFNAFSGKNESTPGKPILIKAFY